MSNGRDEVRIALSGLRATGFHGVLDDERRDGQTFVADIVLLVDADTHSDDLAGTANYAEVAELVHGELTGAPVQLIETLARRIADRIAETQPAVREVTVTVHKPQAPIAVAFEDVTVSVTRGRPIVLALGANLGDAAATLQAAVTGLGRTPGLTLERVSHLYRTAPVGGVSQPDFVNAVVTGHTSLPDDALWPLVAGLEQQHGRVRGVPNGPRTLDIDVVALGAREVHEPHLTVPHPRAHERAFVLVPWREVQPDALLPGHGPIADVVVDTAGVARLDVVPELP